MYEIVIAPTARRAVKKLPKGLKQRIVKEVKSISQNPYSCQKLSGKLQLCYSYHFIDKSTHYRIAYMINEDIKRIVVVLIGSREGFYKKLQRIFR